MRYVYIFIAALLVSGCGTPDITQGEIVSRDHEAGHYYTAYEQRYMGENCYPVYDSYSKTTRQRCQSNYQTVPVQRYDDEDWYLRVHGCPTDDDGKQHCRTEKFEVSEDTYNEAQKGYWFYVEDERVEAR